MLSRAHELAETLREPETSEEFSRTLAELERLAGEAERLREANEALSETNRALQRSAIGNRDGRKKAEAEAGRLREALERGAREGESDSIRAWCYLALHSREAAT